ncbi:MAG: NADH:ubiquinone reductase (Na(+)-transporting) subunit F [Proteobacteria bacterium]|nr:NADH:ubiquinone reductase (Na(+)-transporting) subunit F [Pseudomonadota bacterium]
MIGGALIYLTGLTVFLAVILFLVVMLLTLESFLVKAGDVVITINDDTDKTIRTKAGKPLLFALSEKNVLLPSACGGKGSCAMCKCVVEEGGMEPLPTELAQLSRKERKEHVRLACQLKVRENLKIKVPEEIFSIRKYDGVVVSNENVATFIKLLVMKLDTGQTLDFKAGNYMQIDIPAYDLSFSEYEIGERFKASWERFGLTRMMAHSDAPVFRAYSLANPPSEKDVLKFTVRIATPPAGSKDIPPGVGSSYIFDLKPGDRITVSGPYGDFFVKDTKREVCFIGGGAGMAPMRSHILDQLEDRKTDRTTTFWYGARSKQEMFFDEEFKALEEKHNNFTYHVALSEPLPEENWNGLKGLIHQCLYEEYLESHDDPTEIEYYLCGPPMMIDAVLNMLDDLGVEPDMIAYDKF